MHRKAKTLNFVPVNKHNLKVHYSSNHDKAIFKAIISGELVRYDMLKEKYITMATLLKTRLISRGYRINLIDKTTATVQYEARDQLLSASKKPQPRFNPPVYKCLLPPQFTVLILKKLQLDAIHGSCPKVYSPTP